jgi:hypothetical protein
MTLNTVPFELVRNSGFVVGDRPLFSQGKAYHPGDEYPTEGNGHTLRMLYELNRIVVKKESELESEVKPKGKKKRKT